MARMKTWEEYRAECEPMAKARGIVILGIVEPHIGCDTKMILSCPLHGEWITTSIDKFKQGRGCPGCKNAAAKQFHSVSDDQHIEDFMKTGKFKEGTIFANTGKRNRSKAGDIIWMIECPICSHDEYVQAGVCDGKFYATGGHIKTGRLPCRCGNYRFNEIQITYRIRKELKKRGYTWIGWVGKSSSMGKFRFVCNLHGEQIGNASGLLYRSTGCPQCANKNQQQGYINYIYDEEGALCALKFGIANDSFRRIKEQNSRNVFTMQQYQVWEFPTVEQCKDAERMCKHTLDTRTVSKYTMEDGHTETVELSSLASIQNVYTIFGGVLQK